MGEDSHGKPRRSWGEGTPDLTWGDVKGKRWHNWGGVGVMVNLKVRNDKDLVAFSFVWSREHAIENQAGQKKTYKHRKAMKSTIMSKASSSSRDHRGAIIIAWLWFSQSMDRNPWSKTSLSFQRHCWNMLEHPLPTTARQHTPFWKDWNCRTRLREGWKQKR